MDDFRRATSVRVVADLTRPKARLTFYLDGVPLGDAFVDPAACTMEVDAGHDRLYPLAEVPWGGVHAGLC